MARNFREDLEHFPVLPEFLPANIDNAYSGTTAVLARKDHINVSEDKYSIIDEASRFQIKVNSAKSVHNELQRTCKRALTHR